MKILQTANLGKALGGISGSIRYVLYNTVGTEVSASTNSGIYELGSSTGLYGVELNCASNFSGSIVWSCTADSNVFATEKLDVDEKFVRHVTTGRWKVDEDEKQMIFYQEDNATVVARYNLFDKSGTASVETVFDRVFVSGSA